MWLNCSGFNKPLVLSNVEGHWDEAAHMAVIRMYFLGSFCPSHCVGCTIGHNHLNYVNNNDQFFLNISPSFNTAATCMCYCCLTLRMATLIRTFDHPLVSISTMYNKKCIRKLRKRPQSKRNYTVLIIYRMKLAVF